MDINQIAIVLNQKVGIETLPTLFSGANRCARPLIAVGDA